MGCTLGKVREMHFLKNARKGHLRPLKSLAWKGRGVSNPILNIVYINTVAPTLMMYKGAIQNLDVMQNRGRRKVLGCPRNTNTEIMRMEFRLSGIKHSVRELWTAAALSQWCRRQQDDDDVSVSEK